ncbi:hypothetical protein [Ferruginibacter sp.]
MIPTSFQTELETAVPQLLDLARGLTCNNISNNCKFIFSEIKNSDKKNFEIQRLVLKENEKKTPVLLEELMPTLQKNYNNFYDINLQIHKSSKKITIIDVRCFFKNSLDNNYKQTIINNPPMLHFKVPIPNWLTNKQERFDINWEHHKFINYWKIFWARQKLRMKRR